MIPRIKSISPMADFKLLVDFDEGRRVIYDVADDIRSIEAFKELQTLHGLFNNARLDSSRTCVVWNERVDLPSDTIYERLLTCASSVVSDVPRIHMSNRAQNFNFPKSPLALGGGNVTYVSPFKGEAHV